MDHCEVAIIGAGPYGLSIAAHLKAAGVDFRIFGSTMGFWKDHMPAGMHLKSEGFASSLYDPGHRFPLRTYCRQNGLPYEDTGCPVPLDVFTAYGIEFQQTFVPGVEDVKVEHLRQAPGGFLLTHADGRQVAARRVVVAVGLAYYAHMPPILASLPAEFVSHSSSHGRLGPFKGRQVIVVGAGASAIDLAALLDQQGASVEVLARGPAFRFQEPPADKRPGWLNTLRKPVTGIGSGWKLFFCANMPLLFRRLPREFRIDRVRRTLGPAPCWFTRDLVVGKVGLHSGLSLDSASVKEGKVHLCVIDRAGVPSTMVADHIIAATGYQPDVGRIAFLDAGIQAQIRRVGDSPALSPYFESSVAGLYFVGASAANTFGPLLRFAFGAQFTAPRIAGHLARKVSSHRTAPVLNRKPSGPLDSGSTASPAR